jgi:hypothetical protein
MTRLFLKAFCEKKEGKNRRCSRMVYMARLLNADEDR